MTTLNDRWEQFSSILFREQNPSEVSRELSKFIFFSGSHAATTLEDVDAMENEIDEFMELEMRKHHEAD